VIADPWADVPPITTEPGSQNGRAPRLRPFLGRDDLDHLPAPTPLIADTLDQGSVFLLLGYYQTLKSFVAIDWCASVATGLGWQNRAISERRRALYVAAEGAYGLRARVNAWERHRNTRIGHTDLSIYPGAVNLGDPAEVGELCAYVRGEGIGFVTIDTLAKCIPGLDENSSRDMGLAVTALYALRDAAGPTGVIGAVHHTGKNRSGARGSSALESGVDTVYETDGTSALVSLTRTKRKDGPRQDSMSLRLKLIEGTGSGVAVDNAGLPTNGPAGTDQVVAIVASSLVPLTTAEVGALLTGKVKTNRVSREAKESARRRLLAAADHGLVVMIPPAEPRGPIRWAIPEVHADPPNQDQ
jgi:AAA domain